MTITLNLAGDKYTFRWTGDFEILEWQIDGIWQPFNKATIGCGLELDRAMIIKTIQHKLTKN